jgi:single-strand DNA-binding protein
VSGSVNSALIIGNLGQDPEVRTTASGQMVATLSIATSESFTDKQGERQERTEWHRVIVWGKTAESAQRYLSKGRKVCVQGRIQTRSWDDTATGAKRYATEIQCDKLTFLDSGKGSDGGTDGGSGRWQGGRVQEPASAPAPGASFDDDVPF